MKKLLKDQTGITLLEFLVVVVCVSILVALIFLFRH
jgi:type II secretory pathway pseudopilin PulG